MIGDLAIAETAIADFGAPYVPPPTPPTRAKVTVMAREVVGVGIGVREVTQAEMSATALLSVTVRVNDD